MLCIVAAIGSIEAGNYPNTKPPEGLEYRAVPDGISDTLRHDSDD